MLLPTLTMHLTATTRLPLVLGALLLSLTARAQTADDFSPPPAPPQEPSRVAVPTDVPGRYEYEGYVPQGYHLVSQPRWGLVGGGAAMFSASYAASAALGAAFNGTLDYLFIPVVGAFVLGVQAFAAVGHESGWFAGLASFFEVVGGILCFADGILQAGGLAMFIVGLAKPTQWLEKTEAPPPAVRVSVGAPRAPLGLTLALALP